MEIQEHKKGVMQAVSICITFIFLLPNLYSQKEQELIGTFKQDDQKSIISEVGTYYNFQQDGTFSKVNISHLNTETKIKGTYNLDSNKLLLYYNSSDTINNSFYKLQRKDTINFRNEKPFLSTSLSIYDQASKEPIPGANLSLYGKDNTLLMGFISDKDGRFPHLSINSKIFSKFIFSYLGYPQFTLKTDSIYNFSSEIMIFLNKNSSAKEYKVATAPMIYSINIISKNRIVLYNGENEKLILEKVSP